MDCMPLIVKALNDNASLVGYKYIYEEYFKYFSISETPGDEPGCSRYKKQYFKHGFFIYPKVKPYEDSVHVTNLNIFFSSYIFNNLCFLYNRDDVVVKYNGFFIDDEFHPPDSYDFSCASIEIYEKFAAVRSDLSPDSYDSVVELVCDLVDPREYRRAGFGGKLSYLGQKQVDLHRKVLLVGCPNKSIADWQASGSLVDFRRISILECEKKHGLRITY